MQGQIVIKLIESPKTHIENKELFIYNFNISSNKNYKMIKPYKQQYMGTFRIINNRVEKHKWQIQIMNKLIQSLKTHTKSKKSSIYK